MTTSHDAGTPPRTLDASSALRSLRQDAGFKTAIEFAQSLGISKTTYSRYETDPRKIPVSAAWRIADALGCSIDAVVGHRDPDAPDANPVQRLYDSLSAANRARLDEYLDFIEYREFGAIERRR